MSKYPPFGGFVLESPEKNNTASVMLVDDHPLLRKGLRQLIELTDNLEVVAEAGNGADAVRLGSELDPDLILLDLNMQVMDGLETLTQLRAAEVTSRIVIPCMFRSSKIKSGSSSHAGYGRTGNLNPAARRRGYVAYRHAHRLRRRRGRYRSGYPRCRWLPAQGHGARAVVRTNRTRPAGQDGHERCRDPCISTCAAPTPAKRFQQNGQPDRS